MSEENSEVIAETLQKILVLVSEYASEQVGVANILGATDEEITDANRDFLNRSDDLRVDIISRQRVLNAISEIVDKIDDAFSDETVMMDLTSLSAKCTAAGADEFLTKALVDDFWGENK